MKTLFMTKGLPASGKSTWAKEQVVLAKGKTSRINKDDLRAMIGKPWSPGAEQGVIEARNACIDRFLADGQNVIVDDTNFAPKHEQVLQAMARKHSADFKLVDFTDVPVETCLKRDLGRPGAVGHNVIMDMYYKYLCASAVKPIEGLPACVICDIDGTVAKTNGRGPFEEDKVLTDLPRRFVIQVVNAFVEKHGAKLIMLSGRQASCHDDTLAWLEQHGIISRCLYMRGAGDKRPDYVIKEELYRQHIEGKYNVAAIFDDRMQVIRRWEALGLGDRLFRCGESMREF